LSKSDNRKFIKKIKKKLKKRKPLLIFFLRMIIFYFTFRKGGLTARTAGGFEPWQAGFYRVSGLKCVFLQVMNGLIPNRLKTVGF
jgi:hypothetical protein